MYEQGLTGVSEDQEKIPLKKIIYADLSHLLSFSYVLCIPRQFSYEKQKRETTISETAMEKMASQEMLLCNSCLQIRHFISSFSVCHLLFLRSKAHTTQGRMRSHCPHPRLPSGELNGWKQQGTMKYRNFHFIQNKV